MAGEDGPSSPMQKVCNSSLASSLWPASSNPSVASFPLLRKKERYGHMIDSNQYHEIYLTWIVLNVIELH